MSLDKEIQKTLKIQHIKESQKRKEIWREKEIHVAALSTKVLE